jgi:hypothetical protein
MQARQRKGKRTAIKYSKCTTQFLLLVTTVELIEKFLESGEIRAIFLQPLQLRLSGIRSAALKRLADGGTLKCLRFRIAVKIERVADDLIHLGRVSKCATQQLKGKNKRIAQQLAHLLRKEFWRQNLIRV